MKEIYFAQANPPGRMGLSDITVCDELGVSVAEEAFPHRLYQFALVNAHGTEIHPWRMKHAKGE